VREVWRRPDQEDGVGIDESSNRWYVNFIAGGVTVDKMYFDVEILSSLEKGGMSGFG